MTTAEDRDRLRLVKTEEDLELLYKERGLASVEARARFLHATMGVRRPGLDLNEDFSPLEEQLRDLEELCLSGLWIGLG